MNSFKSSFSMGSSQFSYVDGTNTCYFKIFGELVGIDSDVLEGIEVRDNDIPFYGLIVVNTSDNLFYIQVPSLILNMLLDTATVTLLERAVIIDGYIAYSHKDAVNVVTGSIIKTDVPILIATSFQYPSEIDNVEFLDDANLL